MDNVPKTVLLFALINTSARLLLGLVTLGALIPNSTFGQFGGKPYERWTEKEARALLVESPWAQTRAGLLKGGKLSIFDPRPDDPVDDSAITVRLYSAPPVRQALVRLRQIKNQSEMKDANAKAAIDAENRSVLECSRCTDQYVVTVSPGPGSSHSVPMRFQSMPFAQLKLYVYIKNEKGEKRELVDFVKPGSWDGDSMFIFARLNSKGEPLISPANHTLIISFEPRLFGAFPPSLSRFEFDVGKMMIDGKLVL